ncbi:hypothetical protein CLU79DRAFT_779017 [Phycomyces nitens]|nr:hypothetical protein CLU79DRAFT_779017 [Phycomyces nitens]
MKTRNMTANAPVVPSPVKLRSRSRRLKEAGKASLDDVPEATKTKTPEDPPFQAELPAKEKRKISPEIDDQLLPSNGSRTQTTKRRKLYPRRTLVASSAWTISSSTDNLFEDTQSESYYLSDAEKRQQANHQPAVVLGVSSGVKNNKKKTKATASKSKKFGSCAMGAPDWNVLVVVPPQCRNTPNDKNSDTAADSESVKDTTTSDALLEQTAEHSMVGKTKTEEKTDKLFKIESPETINLSYEAETYTDTEMLAIGEEREIVHDSNSIPETAMDIDQGSSQPPQDESNDYIGEDMDMNMNMNMDMDKEVQQHTLDRLSTDETSRNSIEMTENVNQIDSEDANVDKYADHSMADQKQRSDDEQMDISDTTYQNISSGTDDDNDNNKASLTIIKEVVCRQVETVETNELLSETKICSTETSDVEKTFVHVDHEGVSLLSDCSTTKSQTQVSRTIEQINSTLLPDVSPNQTVVEGKKDEEENDPSSECEDIKPFVCENKAIDNIAEPAQITEPNVPVVHEQEPPKRSFWQRLFFFL